MTLAVTDLRGLAVSDCQVTFDTFDRPAMSGRAVYVRAVPTLGSNARTTQLQFRPALTKENGTGWDRYKVPDLLVSFAFIIYFY